jgi:hypothetical protein
MSQNNVSLPVLVESVIADFVSDNVLFTALDVSNKVKETMPFARHREVRNEVRTAWTVTIEPNGYGRTPISVNLADGSVVEALLYHPLSDSWDLDTKYDTQQRAKTAARPATVATVTTAAPVAVTVGATSISVSNTGAIINTPLSTVVTAAKIVTPAPATTTVAVATPPVVATTNAADLWNNLFQTQPSLFPRR